MPIRRLPGIMAVSTLRGKLWRVVYMAQSMRIRRPTGTSVKVQYVYSSQRHNGQRRAICSWASDIPPDRWRDLTTPRNVTKYEGEGLANASDLQPCQNEAPMPRKRNARRDATPVENERSERSAAREM
jgi:hypothetical protein